MILVGGDFHYPFHNRAWVSSFVKRSKEAKTVVLNGDVLDCYSLSRFDIVPNTSSFQREIREVTAFLKRLRKATNARIIFNEGNHENRFFKKIINAFPEMYDMVSLRELLDLDGIGIEWNPMVGRDSMIELDGWLIGHFDKASKNAAEFLMDKYYMNVVQSHTHRLRLASKTVWNRTVAGAEIGCMCSINPTYVHTPNWQNGYAVIDGDIQLISKP